MTINERIHFYQSLSLSHQNLAEKYNAKLAGNSLLRVSAVMAGALCAYFLRHQPVVDVMAVASAILLFAYLLKRHNRLSELRNRSATIQKISENELKAFRFDFSNFDGAGEHTDPTHDFSFDLDLFGDKSLFQQVNRTTLPLGKESLTDMFKHPMGTRKEIERRQEAVKELSGKDGFTIEFRATGLMADDAKLTKSSANALFQSVEPLANSRFWKITTVAVPAIYALMFALTFVGMPGNFIMGFYLLTLALSSVPMKQIFRTQQNFDNKTKILQAYSRLFGLMENQSFENEELRQLQHLVSHPQPASKATARLISLCRNLNQSFAFPVLLLLNPFLMWNVRYALKINRWAKEHAGETGKWFSALGQMDALISMGTFAANHPDYVFPECAESFRLVGEQMGHPLIPPQKCVKNDIHITGKPYFMIVTGANMAGKSTYLRTVGINFLLASAGLPADAKSMQFYPGKLLTNLRTADSLVNNESYFFAELKRLKMIIDRLKSGEEGLFIILDEILKGTNSEDKQKGSLSLMKRLLELGGDGIIATHDLTLGVLEEEFPGKIKNFHFDASISGDTLSFDYKLHAGIARNMNASFLMKKMGIVG